VLVEILFSRVVQAQDLAVEPGGFVELHAHLLAAGLPV